LAGATGDEAGQQDAVERLEACAAEFGAFIEAATDGELPGSTVEGRAGGPRRDAGGRR
jgi:hypothetical protein